MAPQSSISSGTGKSSRNDSLKNNTLISSFPGIFRYTGERGSFHPNVYDWLRAKRRDDDIGNYWRVHDKLYDLEDFKNKHPGGRDWIEFSKGTDITEAFESSHLVDVAKIEKILAKYYVAEAKTPRNSPYKFDKNGFYKTLKRRVEPILKEVGMEPSREATMMIDTFAILYMIAVLIGVSYNSTLLLLIAGTLLGMLLVAAHNFFHKKDNWRIFYFDLGTLSSHEWRISHAYSHHLYPNTVLDYEVLMGEPIVEMLPLRDRNFVNKLIIPIVVDGLYTLYGIEQVPMRLLAILQGKQKFRPENLIVFLELVVFSYIAPTIWSGFMSWILVICASTFWFAFVSNNSAHHHPACFHDGDQSRPDPDFGLCQLDATASKTDWYHRSLLSVLTTFGEHPLHHLFPTVCHGKLKYLKPSLEQTLDEFSEQVMEFTQWQLFVGTHQQMRRTKSHKFRNKRNE